MHIYIWKLQKLRARIVLRNLLKWIWYMWLKRLALKFYHIQTKFLYWIVLLQFRVRDYSDLDSRFNFKNYYFVKCHHPDILNWIVHHFSINQVFLETINKCVASFSFNDNQVCCPSLRNAIVIYFITSIWRWFLFAHDHISQT